MSQTQQERKTETRARLLAAAADLFAEQGIDAVSVDAVAEAAGRTSGAVYAHFGSKQGLLLALLDSWKDSVVAVLLAQVAVTQSPHDQLAAVWDNVAMGSRAGTARWQLLEHELWLRAARDPEIAAILRARNAEARRFSSRHLGEWTAAVGAQPSADPDQLAVLVRALLIGLAMQRNLEPATVNDEVALRGLSALLGLDKADARSRSSRQNDREPAHSHWGRKETQRGHQEVQTNSQAVNESIRDHSEDTDPGATS